MAGQTVIVSVLADTKRFNSGLNNASGRLNAFGRNIGAFSAVVAIGVAASVTAVANLVGASLLSASELEQYLGGTEVIFGKFAKNIEGISTEAYKTIGLSQNEYLKSANILGALLTPAGLAGERLVGTVDDLIERGADLSALFGGTPARAVEALTSALKGNYEMLDEYGINLTAKMVSDRALRDSGKESVTQLTEQEKGIARVNLLLESSDIAGGQFQREAGTFAGSLAIFQARLQNFLNDVGVKLLPQLEGIFPALTDEINKFVDSPEFATFVDDLARGIGQLVAVLPDAVKFVAKLFHWLADPENQKTLVAVVGAIVALPPAIKGLTFAVDTVKAIGGALLLFAGGATTVFTALRFLVPYIKDFSRLVGGMKLFPLMNPVGKWMILSEGIQGALEDLRLGIAKNVFTPEALAQAKASEKFLAGLGKVVDNVGLAAKRAMPFLKPFFAAFTTFSGFFSKVLGPISIVIAVVQYFIGVQLPFLVGAFQFIISEFQKSLEFWGAIFERLAPVVENVGARIGLALDVMGQVIKNSPIGPAVETFLAVLKLAWQLVVNWWEGDAVKPFKDFLNYVYLVFTDPLAANKITTGFVDGLRKGFSTGMDNFRRTALREFGNFVTDIEKLLGINSPSKVMAGIGRNMGLGLVAGFAGTQNLVAKTSASIVDTAVSSFSSPFGPSMSLASAGGGNNYQITVQAIAPNAEVGRAVVKSISDYERANGKR